MFDWEPYIHAWTARLREGADPLYAKVADLLRQQGIDVQSAVLASFPIEGSTYASGVVVTPDRRVFEFEVSYPDKVYAQAALRSWCDVTAGHGTRGFRDRAAAGLTIVGRTAATEPIEAAS
jgi:hypothetical protein